MRGLGTGCEGGREDKELAESVRKVVKEVGGRDGKGGEMVENGGGR